MSVLTSSSHKNLQPLVAPKNVTSCPVSFTPTVKVLQKTEAPVVIDSAQTISVSASSSHKNLQPLVSPKNVTSLPSSLTPTVKVLQSTVVPLLIIPAKPTVPPLKSPVIKSQSPLPITKQQLPVVFAQPALYPVSYTHLRAHET